MIDPLLPEVMKTTTCWVFRHAPLREDVRRLLLGTPAKVVSFGDALTGHGFDQIFCQAPCTEQEHAYVRDVLTLRLRSPDARIHLI